MTKEQNKLYLSIIKQLSWGGDIRKKLERAGVFKRKGDARQTFLSPVEQRKIIKEINN